MVGVGLVGQLELLVECREHRRWQLVGKKWVPKDYCLFAVLGATDTFGGYLGPRRSLPSLDGPPVDPSPEVLQAVEEMSEDEDLVRNIGLDTLLAYPWRDGETRRFLAGALGFHCFETRGETKRLLAPDAESGAQSLGLSKVTNEEMRSIIQQNPSVLDDLLEKAAGAYTFVEAKSTTARELSFEDALEWLESCVSQSEREQARVTMIMSV